MAENSNLHNTADQSSAVPQQNDAQPQMRQGELSRMLMDTWKSFYPTHRNQVSWMTAGLLAACSFFVLGFWRGLVLILFVSIGYIYGKYRDGNSKVALVIARLSKRMWR